jgi:hypothetical protein
MRKLILLALAIFWLWASAAPAQGIPAKAERGIFE